MNLKDKLKDKKNVYEVKEFLDNLINELYSNLEYMCNQNMILDKEIKSLNKLTSENESLKNALNEKDTLLKNKTESFDNLTTRFQDIENKLENITTVNNELKQNVLTKNDIKEISKHILKKSDIRDLNKVVIGIEESQEKNKEELLNAINNIKSNDFESTEKKPKNDLKQPSQSELAQIISNKNTDDTNHHLEVKRELNNFTKSNNEVNNSQSSNIIDYNDDENIVFNYKSENNKINTTNEIDQHIHSKDGKEVTMDSE
ncbi:MAG: hypothetical protein R3Y64_08615 [Peptostreptococcaceae bacterium]